MRVTSLAFGGIPSFFKAFILSKELSLPLSKMETQFKHGLNRSTGFDGTIASHGYNMRPSSSSASSSYMQKTIYILRATTTVLTLVSAIIMGTGKDTARVSITNPITMQNSNFVETVRARYSSSLVRMFVFIFAIANTAIYKHKKIQKGRYFIVVNVFMFLYSASSLAASLLNKAKSKHIELAFKIADTLFLVLFFSSNGSAITTSLIIQNGNVNLGMIKICDAVATFCVHVTASIVLSMLGALAHLVIILLGIIGMHTGD